MAHNLKVISAMAFRFETRREMMASFLIMANEEERAQAKIQEIMAKGGTMALSEPIKQALLTGMSHLASSEPTSWRLFEWFTRNMSQILQAFEQVMNDPQNAAGQQVHQYMNEFGPIDMENPPPIDVARIPQTLMEINGQAEALLTLVENAALILKNMPQQIRRPNIDGMTVEQVSAWAAENSRYVNSARWMELNPVYQYENGWQMIRLTNDKDYQRAGKELGNCIRHSPPPAGMGFLGHPGIFILVDEAQKPLAALRMGSHDRSDMSICYDAKAFDSEQALQIEAKEYKDYINEFLSNTTPEQVYGGDYDGNQWEASPQWLAKFKSSISKIAANACNL